MPTQELRSLGDQERSILERYLSECPVRLGALAAELGVSVKVSSLRTGISGQISREPQDNAYVIRVNRHEARQRQRFTIAHELAHFLLHRHIIDSIPEGITDNVLYRSGVPERIEFEANRLAAEIVMPRELVQQKLQEEYGGLITEATIEKLASEFQVSKAAMEIRLSTLGQTDNRAA